MDNVDEQQVESQTATEPASQEDIFAQVFGQPETEQFVAKAESAPEIIEESQPSDVQDTSDPKSDNDSYQYWQSQADKKATEVELLKSQVSELMSRASQPAPAPVEKETETLSRPVKPRKPADYDHSEALADPESMSGKYLAKQDQYMDNLANYMESMDQQRETKLKATLAEQEAMTRNQKVMNDLQSKYSYTPDQANDFIQQMSKPDSLSLDNLVKLHRMNTGNAPQQVTQVNQVTPEAQQKQQLMQSRQQKLSIPKPIGVQPGANVQSSKSVEDKMMDSMIGQFKKKNPF